MVPFYYPVQRALVDLDPRNPAPEKNCAVLKVVDKLFHLLWLCVFGTIPKPRCLSRDLDPVQHAAPLEQAHVLNGADDDLARQLADTLVLVPLGQLRRDHFFFLPERCSVQAA